MSVIFGVFHMSLGIINKGQNCVYFSDYTTLFCEVITGLIILFGLFGYMDFLIIMKWFTQVDIDYPRTWNETKPNRIQMQKLDGNFKADGNTWQRENEMWSSMIPGIINVMIGESIGAFNCKAADHETLDLLT
jgi:vacuolar-type H+-ATPase subunit I/STV1